MNVMPKLVKMKLDNSIQKIILQKEKYVRNPSKDFTRTRKLSLAKLIELLITMGAGSLNKELLEYYKFDTKTPTSSALVQQRSKLKPEALLYILQEFSKSFKQVKKFKGHRLLAVDGSKITIHRNPNDLETFVTYNEHSKGCNVLNLNALYDICNKLYVDAIIQPLRKMNERSALIEMIKRSSLKEKIILVADRGYESYNNIAHLEEKGWKYVIRVRASNIQSGILSKVDLPLNQEFDKKVSILMTRRQTKEIKSNPMLYRYLPPSRTFDFLAHGTKGTYPIVFRVVCVKVAEDNYQYLITNLTPTFSLTDLKEIYHKRWGIEISFRELKHTIAMLHFKTKKVEHIQQEIYAKMILYNFCEMITLSTVVKQDNNKKYTYQANFTVAMTICIKFLRCYKDRHPPNVEALISKFISPIREGRNFPREIKIQATKGFLYRVA